MPSQPNHFVVLISSLEENELCKSEIVSVTLVEPYHLQSTQKKGILLIKFKDH